MPVPVVPPAVPAAPSMAAPALPSGVLSAVPTGHAFDVVLLLHVAAAVVALGSVAVAGIQAARVLAAGEAGPPAGAAGYYAPGVNWVGRTLHAVPLLGLALVGLSGGAYGFDDAWIEWGLGLWFLAAAGAEAVLWPAERRIQAALVVGVAAVGAPDPTAPDPVPAGRASVGRDCRTAVLAAGAVAAVLVAATVVMVVQP
jgi:hypothetical protein